MIRNDAEYREAVARLAAERLRLAEHADAWTAAGFTAVEVARLKAPLESFHAQLVEEVEAYERLKRGEFGDLENFEGLGRLLIGLRIARGMTQSALAVRLGVDESMVSRDERNEYHGITIHRARRIVEALGARLHTSVALENLAPV